MAKSRISNPAQRKKLEQVVRVEALKTAAELFSYYVKRWTKEEIQRLIQNNELPIIPVKDGFQVGKHRVLPYNTSWGLFNPHSEVMHTFSNKKSAVLYSLLHQSHRFKSADEILGKDQKLSKLEADFQHYDHTMRRAIKRKDYGTIDITASRYYDAKSLLEEARNDLEKTLRMNKYLKVWETGKPL